MTADALVSSKIVTRLRWLNSPYGEVVAAFRAGRRLSFSRRRPRAIARPMLSLLMNRPVVFHAHAASKSQRGSTQQVRDLFVPSAHCDPILTPGRIELNSAGSSDPRGLEIIENWRNYPGGPIQPNSSGGPTGPGGSEVHFSCIEPDKPGFVHECRKCSSTQSFVTRIESTIS